MPRPSGILPMNGYSMSEQERLTTVMVSYHTPPSAAIHKSLKQQGTVFPIPCFPAQPFSVIVQVEPELAVTVCASL